jgi:type I restriction enzyme M protein
MNADDFRDYMLSFLFLRYLSDNYEEAAAKELAKIIHRSTETGANPHCSSGMNKNPAIVAEFEKQMRRKIPML